MFSWLGDLGKIIGGLFHLATDPLTTVWSWFFNTFMGNPTHANTPLGFLFQTLTGQLDPTSLGIVPHMYAIMAPLALGVLSIATAARYFMLMKTDQVAPSMAIYDVMPRYLILALLLAPGTNIGYHLFGYASDAFSQLGGAITGGLLTTFTLGHVTSTLASAFETDILVAIASFLSGAAIPMVSLVVVFGISMLCLILYLVILMTMRTVMLIFGLTFMPIALPIAAYDPHNAFFRWWLGTVLGALVAQIIGGAGFAITLSLAISTPGKGPLKILTAILLMDAGLLFTTKAVKAAESGTVSGAGMGLGGLVETMALAPRAARNLLGTRINSENSGSFTALGRRTSTAHGGGGGGAGNGGWSAGRRGMAGFLFPRHNVSADMAGVGLSTVAGAAKGALRPGAEGRPRSLILGAQRGYHAGMGSMSHSEFATEYGEHTTAGRQLNSHIDSRLQNLDATLGQQHEGSLAESQAHHQQQVAYADEVAAGRHDDEVGSWLGTQQREYAQISDSHRAEYANTVRAGADSSLTGHQQRLVVERASAHQEFERIRSDALAQGHANAQARLHPTAQGKSGRLTNDQEAHLEARMRAVEQKYGVRSSGDE